MRFQHCFFTHPIFVSEEERKTVSQSQILKLVNNNAYQTFSFFCKSVSGYFLKNEKYGK